jgi:hypothetical protein
LLAGVRQITLRYRDREGGWSATWTATDRTRLPRAIELVSTTESHGSVRQLFLVAGGG